MELESISAQIRGFIREKFDVPDSDPDFNDDVHLFEYGYIDSFGAVDLTRFVESTFGIEVRESDLVACPLNTVRQIAVFVSGRKDGEG